MARVDREEVERVAKLARLTFSPDEAARIAEDLESILGYVETLNELDTEQVELMSHVIPLATPMRDDCATSPLDPELVVANAPAHEGSSFVVPKVIEGEDEG